MTSVLAHFGVMSLRNAEHVLVLDCKDILGETQTDLMGLRLAIDQQQNTGFALWPEGGTDGPWWPPGRVVRDGAVCLPCQRKSLRATHN